MSIFLQNNPKEKMIRLRQLLDWGYIDNEEADSMYKQYCLLFEGSADESTETQNKH